MSRPDAAIDRRGCGIRTAPETRQNLQDHSMTKIASMTPPVPRGKIIGKRVGARPAAPADSSCSTSSAGSTNAHPSSSPRTSPSVNGPRWRASGWSCSRRPPRPSDARPSCSTPTRRPAADHISWVRLKRPPGRSPWKRSGPLSAAKPKSKRSYQGSRASPAREVNFHDHEPHGHFRNRRSNHEKRELIGSLNIVSLPYLRDVFRRILR